VQIRSAPYLEQGGGIMEAIMLSGPSDCGKTQSLRRVYWSLKNRSNCTELFANWEEVRRRAPKDLMALLRMDTLVIGIATLGDPCEELIRNFAYMVSRGCHVIVCATRTRGGYRDEALKLLYQNQYHVEELRKFRIGLRSNPPTQEQEADNLRMATLILERVDFATSQAA
jgi:hypothetical protein